MRRNPIRAAKRTPCVRRSYWGRGGAGMMFVCSEDRTVLLLLRAEWVEQGGTWGVPGGGIGEGFFSTPMEPIDDPEVFLRKAVQEVEEMSRAVHVSNSGGRSSLWGKWCRRMEVTPCLRALLRVVRGGALVTVPLSRCRTREWTPTASMSTQTGMGRR